MKALFRQRQQHQKSSKRVEDLLQVFELCEVLAQPVAAACFSFVSVLFLWLWFVGRHSPLYMYYIELSSTSFYNASFIMHHSSLHLVCM